MSKKEIKEKFLASGKKVKSLDDNDKDEFYKKPTDYIEYGEITTIGKLNLLIIFSKWNQSKSNIAYFEFGSS